MAEPKKKMFIHGPELEQFPYPESCPFKISRVGKVFEKLQSMGLFKGGDKVVLAPERATDADLLKFHSEPYLKALKRIDRGEYEMGMLMMQLGFLGMRTKSSSNCSPHRAPRPTSAATICPDPAKTAAAMRPSSAFNAIIDAM